MSSSYWDAEEAEMQEQLRRARVRIRALNSGQKKTYEPDPKPVARPKKGKRGK